MKNGASNSELSQGSSLSSYSSSSSYDYNDSVAGPYDSYGYTASDPYDLSGSYGSYSASGPYPYYHSGLYSASNSYSYGAFNLYAPYNSPDFYQSGYVIYKSSAPLSSLSSAPSPHRGEVFHLPKDRLRPYSLLPEDELLLETVPIKTLQFIKVKLADNNLNPGSVNIMAMDTKQFKEICDGFEKVFNAFDDFGFSEEQLKTEKIKKFIIDNQCLAIFMYMTFSLYVHEWSTHSTTKLGSVKKKAISALDHMFLVKIANFIKWINEVDEKDYLKLTDDLSYHQRQLMIQGSLSRYAIHFITNDDGDIRIDMLLKYFVFSISPDKLKQSREKAINRKSQTPNSSEEKVNCTLFELLNSVDQNKFFKPMKKSPTETFIHSITGVEMDFPMEGVTVETDGLQHSCNGIKVPFDNLKEKMLVDLGWARISIPTEGDIVAKAEKIAFLLHIPQLAVYVKIMRNAACLREEIIKKIIEAQSEYCLSDDYKQICRSYFIDLLDVLSTLSNFLDLNHLAVLLNNVDREDNEKIFGRYFKTSSKIRKLKKELDNLEKNKKDLNDQIAVLNLSDVPQSQIPAEQTLKRKDLENELSEIEKEIEKRVKGISRLELVKGKILGSELTGPLFTVLPIEECQKQLKRMEEKFKIRNVSYHRVVENKKQLMMEEERIKAKIKAVKSQLNEGQLNQKKPIEDFPPFTSKQKSGIEKAPLCWKSRIEEFPPLPNTIAKTPLLRNPRDVAKAPPPWKPGAKTLLSKNPTITNAPLPRNSKAEAPLLPTPMIKEAPLLPTPMIGSAPLLRNPIAEALFSRGPITQDPSFLLPPLPPLRTLLCSQDLAKKKTKKIFGPVERIGSPMVDSPQPAGSPNLKRKPDKMVESPQPSKSPTLRAGQRNSDR